jgi:dTDP-glucose 4,6-dehydratase
MRVLVTGAAGFVGFHLCQRLLDDGCTVLAVDNLSSGQHQNAEDLRGQGCRFLPHDICQPIPIEDPIDQIYNMACPASPDDFARLAIPILRTCGEGTYHLLELARAKGARFLQASTSECYGDPNPEEVPLKETYCGNVSTIGPRAVYDEGKRFAEAMVMAYHRQHGVATRIARIFNTYGPRMRADDGRALPNFINQALRGQPLTVYGDGLQTRSFCYISDLVEGLVRLMASEFVEPVNLGNPEEIPVEQLAGEVIELVGGPSEIAYKPLPTDDPQRRQPDITRARGVLGWSPKVARADGIRQTIEYFRSLM